MGKQVLELLLIIQMSGVHSSKIKIARLLALLGGLALTKVILEESRGRRRRKAFHAPRLINFF